VTIYDEVGEYVERHGRLIQEMPSFGGKKRVYRVGKDMVVLDTAPVAPEDIVVAVLREGGLVYLSPAGRQGLETVTGSRVPAPPEGVLQGLLAGWRKEEG